MGFALTSPGAAPRRGPGPGQAGTGRGRQGQGEVGRGREGQAGAGRGRDGQAGAGREAGTAAAVSARPVARLKLNLCRFSHGHQRFHGKWGKQGSAGTRSKWAAQMCLQAPRRGCRQRQSRVLGAGLNLLNATTGTPSPSISHKDCVSQGVCSRDLNSE